MQPPMTPREYLDEICRPNFVDFASDPTSMRRAWAAATSLFHFAAPASGRQDHTTSPSAIGSVRLTQLSRPPHPTARS
jgi:hypothetical protein